MNKHFQMFFAFAFLIVFFDINTPGATENCLKEGRLKIPLEGILQESNAFGPPNYGQSPNTDSKIHFFRVLLRKSFCFEYYPDGDGPITLIKLPSIKEMQIIVKDNKKIDRNWIGRNVSISGSIFAGQSGSHYTKVLIDADDLNLSARENAERRNFNIPDTKIPSNLRIIRDGTTSYDSVSNLTGDIFLGGDWGNARGGRAWAQRDFGTIKTVRGFQIDLAGTDVTSKGSLIRLMLKDESGIWVPVYELRDAVINRNFSGGTRGEVVPPQKILINAMKATAARLEMSGHGWFAARNILIYE